MHDCMSEIQQHVGQKSADCSVPANVPHPHHGGFVEVETDLHHTHTQGGGECMRGRYRVTGMVIPDENAGQVSMGVLARVNAWRVVRVQASSSLSWALDALWLWSLGPSRA